MLFLYMLAYISSTSAVCPLYDITKSFEGNCKQGPALCHFIPQRSIPPRSEWYCLLGYPIASPIGIPACAIMTSKGIALAAQLGFDVLTYKTICSSKVTSYELPNICYVSCDQHITNNDIGKSFYVADTMQEQSTAIAISNSLGNPSDDVEWVKQDIAQARAALYEGQVLIVSVFGQGTDLDSIAKDFAITAQMAYQAGAQIVELNLSCPNLEHGFFYKNPHMVHAIVQRVHSIIPIPIIIKVGVFDRKEQMREILHSAVEAGAQGVCGINSVPVKIITRDGSPFFGAHRITSGLSGAPIRNLAQQFIMDAHDIITQDNLNLTLLATGGITSPEHFQEFLTMGATIALSGTGMMWNPYLAYHYHSSRVLR